MRKAKTVKIVRKARAAANAAHKEHHGERRQDSVSVGSEHDPESTFSPKDFDTFIPWACQQWASTSVVINRKYQDRYVNFTEQKPTKFKKNKPKDEASIENIDESSVFANKSCTMDNSSLVPVTAYYDANDKLVEISIVRSTVRVSRKVIRAFSLAVPYHSSLKRFTFRSRHFLTAELIYEINKLLPISNICEIILDDSYVPKGNYHILLEQFSQLKYLSLNRCKINDETCVKIFENIRFDAPAANTLQILELGSNEITDEGGNFIGSVLRANRCLVHLNLSGNKITDNGFLRILDSLMEFPLDVEERYEARRRKFKYLQGKTAVYARCLNDIKCANLEVVDSISTTSARKFSMKNLRAKKKKSDSLPMRTIEDEAEIMARGIVGEFYDPFLPYYVVLKDGTSFCKGNFVLCSINIAYNHLEYPSIRKLSEVLQYQEGNMDMDGKDTGLIRITLDGNKIPQTCSELDTIDFYLRKVVKLRKASEATKRTKALSQKRSMHRSRHNSSSHLDI